MTDEEKVVLKNEDIDKVTDTKKVSKWGLFIFIIIIFIIAILLWVFR